MKSRKSCLWLTSSALALGVAILCLGGLYLSWSGQSREGGGERPIVEILQPQPNALLQVQAAIAVQAAARGGQQPIRWLRFYADDLLAGEQSGAGAQVIGTWLWRPTSAGVHTLAFVAVNEAGGQTMETLRVTVVPIADRDGDSVADAQDACPDQAGAPFNQGCPVANDADNDGIPDEEDQCPQEAGLPEERGCRLENRPDGDQDGVPDWEDHCPSQPGRAEWNGCLPDAWAQDSDADGLADIADGCVQQPGPFENNGCPQAQESDRDGDGVLDSQDACPDQAGSPLSQGCPLTDDRDGDGVPDEQDQCPDRAGWPQFNGCLPQGWNTDGDGDGVLDFLDRCDSEAGPPENLGCPLPEDRDSDGLPDDQDHCPERFGPASNNGCPLERAFPSPGEIARGDNSRLCVLIPQACPQEEPGAVARTGNLPLICVLIPQACPTDPCEENPASCDSDGDGLNNAEDRCPNGAGPAAQGGCSCPNDLDCDGILDGGDACPQQFGPRTAELNGCPWDANGNGQPDERDDDSDGIPNEQDACATQRGSAWNNGCPHPQGVEVEVAIQLEGFATPGTAYENFYCYVNLQDGGWTRLPRSGSLPRQGNAYPYNQMVRLTVLGNTPLHLKVFCEGQRDPLGPVEYLGLVERWDGPETWNGYWRAAWSDTQGFLVSYLLNEWEGR